MLKIICRGKCLEKGNVNSVVIKVRNDGGLDKRHINGIVPSWFQSQNWSSIQFFESLPQLVIVSNPLSSLPIVNLWKQQK